MSNAQTLVLRIKNGLVLRSNNLSRFHRNFRHVLLGNLLSQAIPFIALPVLSRLYTPSEFAVLGVFTALTTVVSTIAVFRVDWLTSRIRSDLRAASLLPSAIAGVVLFGSMTALGLYLLQGGAGRYAVALPASVIVLLPVSVTAGSAVLLLNVWFIRHGSLGKVAQARVAQTSSSTIFTVAAGLISPSAVALCFGLALNGLVGVFLLARNAPLRLRTAIRRVTLKRSTAVTRSALPEIGVLAITTAINTAGLYGPTLVLAALYPATQVGWLVMAQRIAGAPVAALSAALSQGLWAEAARTNGDPTDSFRQTYRYARQRLLAMSTVVLVAGLIAPLYLGHLLGKEKWGGAATVLTILAPQLATQFVVSSLSPLLTVFGHERWVLRWDIARTIVLAIAIACAALSNASFFYMLALVSTLTTMSYIPVYRKLQKTLGFVKDACRE